MTMAGLIMEAHRGGDEAWNFDRLDIDDEEDDRRLG